MICIRAVSRGRTHPPAAALGTHLWWFHEVGHIPQSVPELLDLSHRNPFEFGDDRNLRVQVPFLVAFFGKEGPSEEEMMDSMLLL